MLNKLDTFPIIEESKGGYYRIYKNHNGEILSKEFIKENMSDFFPTKDYEIPISPSNYMRFQEGINRIRILNSAIVGYEYFTIENKPVRSKEKFESMPADIKKDGRIKHFWAFPVWNYQEKRVQILELTQKSIMNDIKALIDNPKWGNPKMYDIAITKTGEGLDTDYNTQGEPPITEPDQDIKDAYAEKTINLEALYSNEDPFGVKNSTTK